MKKGISPKTLLGRVIDKACEGTLFRPELKDRVGWFIKNLSEEERKMLKRLRSDDIKEAKRWD